MKRGDSLWPWLGAGILWLLSVVLFGWACRGCEADAAECNPVALAKARVIVSELYPASGFYPYIGTLLAAHETHAAAMGAPGFRAEWWSSLVYGGANAGLEVGARFPGNCAGPMDVKHSPRVLDPVANIRWHVTEARLGWRNGYRGPGLCRYVMLPSNPRDWGGGEFARVDARHRAAIARAYRNGRL